ncbi:MAG: hypothetical protein LBI36_06045 [Oscillospiraceae bacterium]|jgi:hypothetical protein|nr:hypothetical protein [Oscillospiraceae bacterium]
MINSINGNSVASSTITSKNGKNDKIPTIPDILTNGQSKMSDLEIEQKLLELARKDVAAGTNSKFITNGKKLRTDEWFKLSQDYISSASPDRKGIITNTLSKLADKMGSMRINFNSSDFFQVLFQNSNLFGNLSNVDVGSNFMRIFDNNGNEIAFYSKSRGWIAIQTPAENERFNEFSAKWDDALAKAKQELNGNSNVSGGNDGLYVGSA